MKDQTALLVIDAQKLYSSEDSELRVSGVEENIVNINKVITWFEEHQQAIIYVRHVHAPDGSDAGIMFSFTGDEEDVGFIEGSVEVEYIDDLKIIEGAQEIVKHRYSAFVGTNLENILKELKVGRIVIVGFMTNFCCESTTRDAHDRDYYVDFILDATGCPDLETLSQEEIKAATGATLAAGYAVILTTDEFLERSI